MIAGGVAVVVAAEWLHGGGEGAAVWAWLAGAAGAATLLLALRPPRADWRLGALLAALACLGLGVTLVRGVLAVRRIECCWTEVRQARIPQDSVELKAALARAVAEARRLAERGMTAALVPREAAFEHLDRALGSGERGLERGVTIVGPDGQPWAWAGRHRVVPEPDTAELRATITTFYATLEARRQTQAGGQAVGTVLLDAAPAVADREGAVGVAFARAHGVELRFFAPGVAPPPTPSPPGPVSWDYTTQEAGALFTVQPLPPAQGDAKLAALARTASLASAGLALALLLLLLAAPPGRWRWAVVAAGAWALARASLGPPLDLTAFFSPDTFYRPTLGLFSASAGALAVLGCLLLLAAGTLWRRGTARRPWHVVLAALLVLAAPYLVRHFGRGIAPPAGGVDFALWLSWQAALAAGAMGLVLVAAALVRGSVEPPRVPWTLAAACGWATLAGLAGLWLWRPYAAWPEWYSFVWLPALVGVLVPAPRRWALAGIATVAGTAAALATWGAAVEGRLALAERDVRRLGGGREGGGDAVAVALLERLGRQAQTVAPPRSASDLYALWLRSPLAAEAYPTVLALWAPDGSLRADLPLATLDLPQPLLAALARSTARPGDLRVERLERVPGVHYVLVAALGSGDVLTVGVGPWSRLVPPARVARFLRGEQGIEPPYTISLSIPNPGPTHNAATPRLRWRRVGWAAQGERVIELPGGPRHVHVRVDLRGPLALLVRGALVVVADLALLVALWVIGLVVTDGWRPRLPALLTALRTSYRARLAAALAAFFVLPVLAFAVWSFARLGDEARRAGDLLIRQTLRDAVATAGGLILDASGRPAVVELGARLDADLWLYRNGVLVGTSAPVLGELGLVDPLLSPRVYRRLALEDELDVTVDGHTAGRPIRVGYRQVLAGAPGDQGVLAAPQLLDDERIRRQQEDLALVLILATLGGLLAAVVLAGLVARGLAKPVAALREAALAVGQGAAPPAFPPGAPREFAPVISAFERMAADVRRSREALEEARRRTALVLANVATGVVAVDDGLRVTIANPRAEELLGAKLEPGDLLPRATPGDWLPVWNAVGEYLASGGAGGAIAEREFEIGGRQFRVQLAPLGPRPDGCVVALDDATALTRAARVLAWGEMARQVAHEIKNPLTPIRLGIQHLQRVREGRGGKASFDAALEETAGRILAEIDRLDAIARAFSRFGAPPVSADLLPLEAVDLRAVAREVVQLYALDGAARFELAAGGETVGGEGEGRPSRAHARLDEVKEVLMNLLENARNAGAKRVVVRVEDNGRVLVVQDDGRGIPHDALPRVFEPTFSTTSSGSGLGLAIARRLVESWGGTIGLTSEVGRGTTVTLDLRPAEGGGVG